MNSVQQKKFKNLLSVCIKAGKAVKGFDSVCDAVKSGKAFCVLISCDASEKTVKETNFVCNKYGIPVIETGLSKEETGSLFGKSTAVTAVSDRNFADGFAKIADISSDNQNSR